MTEEKILSKEAVFSCFFSKVIVFPHRAQAYFCLCNNSSASFINLSRGSSPQFLFRDRFCASLHLTPISCSHVIFLLLLIFCVLEFYFIFFLQTKKYKILFSNLWRQSKKNVVQIHDSKRKDREALTRTWTRPYGISLEHFPAIMNAENGARGCFDSHVTLARSINIQHPYYFVLEDDAVPTAEANSNVEVLTELENVIANNVYDLIWLGGLPMLQKPFSLFKTHGILPGKCLTTYAMWIGPKAKNFIASLEYTGKPIDVVLSQAHELNTAFVNPALFRQACTPSDIGKSSFTRGKFFAVLLEMCTPVWRNVVIYQNYLTLFLLIFIYKIIVWKG